MKLWQIVAVVTVGVLFGIFQPGKYTYAFGTATLYVLLPALLFEGAWTLQLRAMKRNWAAIATLAVPGVAVTAILIAGALSVVRIPFGVALLTGAILSATDPIAALAVFRRLKVSVSLSTIVICESLFNDAIAVVLYRAVVDTLTMEPFSSAGLMTEILLSIGGSLGGIAIGVAVAFGIATLLRERSEQHTQIIATIVCAYLSYFAAEELHCSGIFATIVSGITLRFFERRWINLKIVHDVDGFWDLAALAANVVVFFLTGAALSVTSIAQYPVFVIATLAGVFVSRIAISVLLVPAGFPSEWLAVVRVAGMRGALSLALALAIPASIPFRNEIIAATFAVALATLASSAITVPRVVERAARRG